MAIEIVDLPVKQGDFPKQHVCLSEGNRLWSSPKDWETGSMVPWFGRVHSDFTWFQMGHETWKTPSHATKKLPGDTTNRVVGHSDFSEFWIFLLISLKELFLGHPMTWSNCIASHSTTGSVGKWDSPKIQWFIIIFPIDNCPCQAKVEKQKLCII